MRPRRWIHPPPCRPPDPHPPPFTPFISRPPPPPRVLRPPPRLHVPQTHPSPPPIASTSRLAPTPSPPPTSTVEPVPPPVQPPQLPLLRTLLGSLPPFPSSTTHGAPRFALYRQKDLEGELRVWRGACARCHALLSALPPAPSEGKGKQKVEPWRVELEEDIKPRIVRLVAETSRLLLHLNHLSAFTDLDRAFFTSKLGGFGRSLSRAIRAAQARGEEVEGRKLRGVSGNPLRMGKGLGWERGVEDVSWMVAFEAALRDRQGRGKGKEKDEKAVEKFGKLVRAMRMRSGKSDEGRPTEQKTGGRSVIKGENGRTGRTAGDRIDSHLLAFLTRIMSRVHARLGTPIIGEPSQGRLLALEEVDLIVEEIKLAEADEGEEVVSMALLESAMSGLEDQASAPQSYGGKTTPVSVDHPLFRKVEEDIEILVARFDNSDVVPPRSSTPNPRFMRDRHAHILYTTIRFLILRARISRSRSSARHSLLSASQLYSILLGLSKSSSSRSPASLARLRVWQSSALYRLIWAHMPASARTGSGRKESTVSFLDSSEFDREAAVRILDVLDLTRAAVADIPPPLRPAGASPTYRQVRDPRLIGMSTSFLRTFLETLVRPFAPQPSPSPPHAHPHPHSHHHSRRAPQAFTPTHDLLDRTLRTILSLRSWDASLPLPPRSHRKREVDHHPWEYRLFSRPNLVIHLVRGWILAPSPSSSQAGKSGRGDSRDHLIPRLSSLLSLFSALVKLPLNECWQKENVGRLAEDVEWAVGEVVERQWGRDRKRGEEGWREEVGRVVREWKGEMREVEEERRKREDEARRKADATSRLKPPPERRRTISYPSLPPST